MKKLLASILLMLVGVSGSKAETYQLPFSADSMDTKFNAFSKANKLGVNITKKECTEGVSFVCTYSVSDQVFIMAQSKTKKGYASSIVMIHGGESNADALRALTVYVTIIGITSPNAPPSERGRIVSALIEGLQSQGEESSAEIEKVTYTLKNMKDLGLWLTVKPQ